VALHEAEVTKEERRTKERRTRERRGKEGGKEGRKMEGGKLEYHSLIILHTSRNPSPSSEFLESNILG
jgi:hypothetical protein